MTAETGPGTGYFTLPKQFGAFKIIRQWIPRSTPARVTSRTGKQVKRFSQIVIGDTGWLALTARDAANDAGQAYGHFIIDDLEIIECIPALTGRAGYIEQARFVETRTDAGDLDAHESALAVNLCFGGAVEGSECFKNCAGLAAFACWWFGLNPGTDIKRAAELDLARKDPDRALAAAGKKFADLIGAIEDAMPGAKASGETVHA